MNEWKRVILRRQRENERRKIQNIAVRRTATTETCFYTKTTTIFIIMATKQHTRCDGINTWKKTCAVCALAFTIAIQNDMETNSIGVYVLLRIDFAFRMSFECLYNLVWYILTYTIYTFISINGLHTSNRSHLNSTKRIVSIL